MQNLHYIHFLRSKAYIPLRRKTICVGYWRWLGPHTFASPNAKDTNMLVYFALSDTNFSRHPRQNPNASQRNIGCVGYQTQNYCVGHVHFMFFVLISFMFDGQCKPSIQWNMGLNILLVMSQPPNPGLSLGKEEWKALVLSDFAFSEG